MADRNNSDYVYLISKLVSLSGNKYHTLKNHINRFNKKFSWEYLPLTPDLREECLFLQDEWCRSKKCIESHHLLNEDKAYLKPIKTGITDGKAIEVVSGLKAGDKIVTLGMNNLKDGTVVVISNK